MSTSPFTNLPEQVTQPEPQPNSPKPSTSNRFFSELGWLGAGLVLPVYSISFYRQVMRRQLKWAIFFFLLLALLLAGLSTARMARGMVEAARQIRAVYTDGRVPEVIIRDGVTTVNGVEPVVLLDSPQMLLVVDTTGQWREIDANLYQQGILLTQRNMHLLNNGRNQIIPLIEYNQALRTNPIIINQKTVLAAWNTITSVLTTLAVIFMLLWNIPLRLGYLALMALVLWGLSKAVRPQTRYTPVLIAGIYAFIPALLISYLLERLDVALPAMQTSIWLIIWIAALVMVYNRVQMLRFPAWLALIGVPMLAVFALDFVFMFPKGALILTAALVLTVIAVLVIAMLEDNQEQPPAEPA